MTLEEMRALALRSGGNDLEPDFGDDVVALIKYIDGTLLDHVMSLK
jgi:citrate lyase alpha subunit